MPTITTTYTAILQTVPMMANATGVSFARGRIQKSFLPDWTRPTRCFMCRVPAGATILDWWGIVATTPTRTGATHTVTIGFAGSTADTTITHTLMEANSSISTSVVVGRFTATAAVEGYGLHISVSDDQQNQYNYLVMMINQGSASVTASISFYGDITVMYTMDNNASESGMITVS